MEHFAITLRPYVLGRAEEYYSEISPGVFELTKSKYGMAGNLYPLEKALHQINVRSVFCAIELDGKIVANFEWWEK